MVPRVLVRHDHVGDGRLRRHVREQLLERLQPAGRGADACHEEARPGGPPGRLRAARGRFDRRRRRLRADHALRGACARAGFGAACGLLGRRGAKRARLSPSSSPCPRSPAHFASFPLRLRFGGGRAPEPGDRLASVAEAFPVTAARRPFASVDLRLPMLQSNDDLAAFGDTFAQRRHERARGLRHPRRDAQGRLLSRLRLAQTPGERLEVVEPFERATALLSMASSAAGLPASPDFSRRVHIRSAASGVRTS